MLRFMPIIIRTTMFANHSMLSSAAATFQLIDLAQPCHSKGCKGEAGHCPECCPGDRRGDRTTSGHVLITIECPVSCPECPASPLCHSQLGRRPGLHTRELEKVRTSAQSTLANFGRTTCKLVGCSGVQEFQKVLGKFKRRNRALARSENSKDENALWKMFDCEHQF